MPPVAKTFDQAEFTNTLDRLRLNPNVDVGQNARPVIDLRAQAEHMAEAISGRKIGDYKQALERGGFGFIPAANLPRLQNGKRPTAGQWRNPRLRAALTNYDVVSWFATPKDLWTWIESRLRPKPKKPRR